IGPAPPLLSYLSRSRAVREVLFGNREEELDDHHVAPAAVEPAVPPVHAHLLESGSAEEGDARRVGGEQEPQDLPASSALGRLREGPDQQASEPPPARPSLDVDRRLPHARVALPGAVFAEPRPADDLALAFCDQERARAGLGDRFRELPGRVGARLEGGRAL